MQKKRNSKASELVQIARDWYHGKEMDKLFQETTRGVKISEYWREKAESQQKKAIEVAEQKAHGKGSDPKKTKTCSSALAEGGFARTKTT